MGKSILEKREDVFNLAEKYGINPDDYADDDNRRTGIGSAEWDQLKGDVSRAAANDYDLRETIGYAAASGKKKAIEAAA